MGVKVLDLTHIDVTNPVFTYEDVNIPVLSVFSLSTTSDGYLVITTTDGEIVIYDISSPLKPLWMKVFGGWNDDFATRGLALTEAYAVLEDHGKLLVYDLYAPVHESLYTEMPPLDNCGNIMAFPREDIQS